MQEVVVLMVGKVVMVDKVKEVLMVEELKEVMMMTMEKVQEVPTFLETSCRASSSKALSLLSLDVMICCSCLKV